VGVPRSCLPGATGSSAASEFLHVDDLADACAFLLRQSDPPTGFNVGTGVDRHDQGADGTGGRRGSGSRSGLSGISSKPDGTRASCWMCRNLVASGGRRKQAFLSRGLRKPTRPSSPTKPPAGCASSRNVSGFAFHVPKQMAGAIWDGPGVYRTAARAATNGGPGRRLALLGRPVLPLRFPRAIWSRRVLLEVMPLNRRRHAALRPCAFVT